ILYLSTTHIFSSSFLSLTRPPPRSTLFPYTTLFRSVGWDVTCWRPIGRSPATDQTSICWPRCSNGSSGSRSEALCSSASTRTSRSEEHTSELQSLRHLVCRLLLEKKKKKKKKTNNIP